MNPAFPCIPPPSHQNNNRSDAFSAPFKRTREELDTQNKAEFSRVTIPEILGNSLPDIEPNTSKGQVISLEEVVMETVSRTLHEAQNKLCQCGNQIAALTLAIDGLSKKMDMNTDRLMVIVQDVVQQLRRLELTQKKNQAERILQWR